MQILRDGCAHMRKAFDIEDVNVDSLIATAMDDPEGGHRRRQGVQGAQLQRPRMLTYAQFCKNETVENSPFDAGEVIAFYNKAMVDLPTGSG